MSAPSAVSPVIQVSLDPASALGNEDSAKPAADAYEPGMDTEEYDADPGMFSFLPAPPQAAASPTSLQSSTFRPFTALSNAFSSATSLTPAAAYALESLPPTSPSSTRRRGSWQYPTSPTSNTNPALSEDRSLRVDKSDAGSTTSKGPLTYELSRLGRTASGDTTEEDYYKRAPLDSAGTLNGLEDPFDYDGYIDDEDSPYPEVRASVSNLDDPEMPALTFRSWFLGILFTVVVSAVNVFFYFRYPAPIVTPVIVQVLSYPLGKLLAWTLPATEFKVPAFMRRMGFEEYISLNPGPFNIKEHTIILIMANAATAPAYGLSFSVASEKYYGIRHGVAFDFALLVSSQLLGFGIAGLSRRFLVTPASLIWPQNLVYCTLLNVLHAEEDDGKAGGGVTRFRFFLYVAVGAFLWYFLPGFLFQALSVFSFVCWMAPTNPVVNQLFGLSSGLGMSLLTFDWSQISYIGSPLVVPWWAEINIIVGFVLAFWIIAPIMYYTNVWESAYLPISSSAVYDRFGSPYNTSAVIDPITNLIDLTAYQGYSPLYLPITFAIVYGISFALSSASVVHTIIYHGKAIMQRIRRVSSEEEDIHQKLMKQYKEVPDLWFLIHLALSTVVAIITITVYDVQVPVWALFVALIIAFIYILPGGYIFAMTSQQITINIIVELCGGYMLPGRPLGNMLFKVYSVSALSLGLSFVQDMKLGHYMKVPPRVTFWVQVVALILSAFVQVGVKEWLVNVVPDLCDPHQAALLICPTTHVFYSASIIWGLIGPARQFGAGQLYNPLLYFILIGAVLPIPFWLLGRKYPKSWFKYVNIPVLLTGTTAMPPATGINYSSWFLVGFIFQYWMRRKNFRWWSKFNFILSAGLDSGTILSGLVIFFCLQLPNGGSIAVDWWGNSVFTNTDDWNGVSYTAVPDAGFGPTTW